MMGFFFEDLFVKCYLYIFSFYYFHGYEDNLVLHVLEGGVSYHHTMYGISRRIFVPKRSEDLIPKGICEQLIHQFQCLSIPSHLKQQLLAISLQLLPTLPPRELIDRVD